MMKILLLLLASPLAMAQSNVSLNQKFLKATYSCNLELVKTLSDQGADLNAIDSIGRTGLMLSSLAFEGKNAMCAEVVHALIEKKALLDQQDSSGETAVMYASHYGNAAIVKLFIKAQANLRLKDHRGNSAAGQANTITVRALLCEAGGCI